MKHHQLNHVPEYSDVKTNHEPQFVSFDLRPIFLNYPFSSRHCLLMINKSRWIAPSPALTKGKRKPRVLPNCVDEWNSAGFEHVQPQSSGFVLGEGIVFSLFLYNRGNAVCLESKKKMYHQP